MSFVYHSSTNVTQSAGHVSLCYISHYFTPTFPGLANVLSLCFLSNWQPSQCVKLAKVESQSTLLPQCMLGQRSMADSMARRAHLLLRLCVGF